MCNVLHLLPCCVVAQHAEFTSSFTPEPAYKNWYNYLPEPVNIVDRVLLVVALLT